MDTWAVAMLAMLAGIKKGDTLDGPDLAILVTCSSMVIRPPMPDPTMVAVFSLWSFSDVKVFSPASS